MKSLVGGTTLAFGLLALLVSACGGDDGAGKSSPVQACNDIAVATCDRAFECLTADVRAFIGLPDTEPACVSEQKAALGCDSITTDNACEGSAVYQPDQASKCVTQTKAASCSQILDAQGETAVFAPACDMICKVG